MQPHLDDTTSRVDGWFFDRKNTFVKQITKQRRKPGGQLYQGQVRSALLALCWEAYSYVANALEMQLLAFAEALPEPLTPEERRVFEVMHLRQPHYGNMPLILLGERLGFVESVVREISDRPGNREPVKVLHRLLQFYSVMASDRREADRKRKRPKDLELHGRAESRAPRGQDRFSRIAAHILVIKKKSCKCANPVWAA